MYPENFKFFLTRPARCPAFLLFKDCQKNVYTSSFFFFLINCPAFSLFIKDQNLINFEYRNANNLKKKNS